MRDRARGPSIFATPERAYTRERAWDYARKCAASRRRALLRPGTPRCRACCASAPSILRLMGARERACTRKRAWIFSCPSAHCATSPSRERVPWRGRASCFYFRPLTSLTLLFTYLSYKYHTRRILRRRRKNTQIPHSSSIATLSLFTITHLGGGT